MSNDKQPDSGIGSRPTNRPAGPAKPGSPSDEKSFIWKQYKPGFEVNQHGHIRTTNHQPPAG